MTEASSEATPRKAANHGHSHRSGFPANRLGNQRGSRRRGRLCVFRVGCRGGVAGRLGERAAARFLGRRGQENARPGERTGGPFLREAHPCFTSGSAKSSTSTALP